MLIAPLYFRPTPNWYRELDLGLLWFIQRGPTANRTLWVVSVWASLNKDSRWGLIIILLPMGRGFVKAWFEDRRPWFKMSFLCLINSQLERSCMVDFHWIHFVSATENYPQTMAALNSNITPHQWGQTTNGITQQQQPSHQPPPYSMHAQQVSTSLFENVIASNLLVLRAWSCYLPKGLI